MILETVLAAGACLCGISEISQELFRDSFISRQTASSLKRAISIAVRLSDKIIDDISGYPTKLYFYHYRQINYMLDRIALKVTDIIQSAGHAALPVPASQTIDWKEQRGHISHRYLAARAGLGWIGRNNLLVTEEYGARIRLVSVLTDMEIKVSEPSSGRCGDCRACITACPAGAIGEELNDFDRMKCFRKLDSFRKEYNIGHHICGVCVKECRGRLNS